jgi:hypothetical protein
MQMSDLSLQQRADLIRGIYKHLEEFDMGADNPDGFFTALAVVVGTVVAVHYQPNDHKEILAMFLDEIENALGKFNT